MKINIFDIDIKDLFLSGKPKGFFLRLALATAVALLLSLLPLGYVEGLLYDLRVRLKPTPPISPWIETLYIESKTVETLKGVPSLEAHIAFLKALQKEQARAVIYLIDPSEIEGGEKQKKELAKIIAGLNNFVYVTDETVMKGEFEKLRLKGVLKDIPVQSGPLTADTKHFAQDEITRRMMLSYQGEELFPLTLARAFRPRGLKLSEVRGQFPFYDSIQTYADVAPPHSFPSSKFIDIIEGKYKEGRFKNKIIFVGFNLGKSSREYVRTPHLRSVTAMTAVEMQANNLNTLFLNSSPVKLPKVWSYIVMFILVILSVEVVLTIKPSRGLFILGGTFLFLTLISFVLFWPFGYWLELAHPLVGVFVTYYLLIPYRLIIESRKTWELIHKNRILMEVEELKSNFMGMMSHDLKTPLARIQGMVEIIQRDRNPLSEDQKTASKSIQQSTEYLLKFISSVLNFNRIESEGVKLHLKTKDLNSLMEEVIAHCEFLAKEKGIRIIKKLEPLFSLKIDPDLIRQVITNLLENAIKYSPPQSSITLKTEERENSVFLHVTDEGVGIPPEELPLLFGKFFRSRRAKNSTNNGSGLGLYLSKYFVELHGGSLRVESEENKGSTFTMELPISPVKPLTEQ